MNCWNFLQMDAERLGNAARDVAATADRMQNAIRWHRTQPTLGTANAVDLAASQLGDALAELDRARSTYTEAETNVLGASALLAPIPEGAAR